jgi:hypothetical protein
MSIIPAPRNCRKLSKFNNWKNTILENNCGTTKTAFLQALLKCSLLKNATKSQFCKYFKMT